MIKKLCSVVLVLAMLTTSLPMTFAATEVKAETATAAYGTPEVDGKIDDVWNTTNHNVIDIVMLTEKDELYRGWFKALWDENNLYVLAKIYGESFDDSNPNPWENDSFEVFVDEDGKKTTKYYEDDYQVRSDFRGFKSGQNYDLENMTASATLNDDHYIVEMAIPPKTVTLKDGTSLGFDIQVNAAPTALSPRKLYGWNEAGRNGAPSSNTSTFGTLKLVKSVDVSAFDEPEIVSPFASMVYSVSETSASAVAINEAVTASYDGTSYSGLKFAYSDENLCMEINDLAKLIGGTVTNGNTLKKDKVTLTYIEGDRIAKYTHADYPNRADYMTTYYYNTSNMASAKTENKLAEIEEQLIPGETAHKPLAENYVNDGTDGENDGYILEVTPFKLSGNLYVPVSSLVPTLNYYIEYDRFASPKTLTISRGTDSSAYPEEGEYKTFYVKDYNAKGDGVTDDRNAVLKAFYAALNHDGPAKLEFEPNKTYRVSAVNTRNAFFDLSSRKDFILEGNGSTILFTQSLNTSFLLNSCTNVQLRNLTTLYEEHTTTQGIIDEINLDEGWFIMTIPEGYWIPPETAFRKAIGGTYGLSIAFDPAEKHMKFLPVDWFDTSEIEHLDGRQVKVTVSASHKKNLTYLNVGDGFVPGQHSSTLSYGITDTTKSDMNAAINLRSCNDILIDGVTITGSMMLGVSVGLCSGTIRFKNYKMRTKDGAANASNSDGIHYWRNRATLLVEDSEFWNNMDDHINTKGERSILTGNVTQAMLDNNQVKTTHDQIAKVGDEILISKRTQNDDEIVLRAFVKAIEGGFNQRVLTLDREIPQEVQDLILGNVANATAVLFDQNSCGAGTCIRGTKFINSRRHSLISRAENTIFMNNYFQNSGGSMVEGANEAASSEGPFPNAFTMRNNRAYGDGMSEGSHTLGVVVFRNYGQSTSIEPQMDGVLIQGNILQVDIAKQTMLFNSVKDLYLINNTIKWASKWDSKHTDLEADYAKYNPILITNCGIAKIDGLHFDYPVEVESIITLGGCGVDEADITNITTRAGNNSTPYIIKGGD